MTPEEVQQALDIIRFSEASSARRMDRLEENLSRLERKATEHDANLTRLEYKAAEHDANLTRLEAEAARQREDTLTLRESVRLQRESLNLLAQMFEDLMSFSRSHLERTKQVESRSDSIDEMIRILRELVEGNLRRPGGPASSGPPENPEH
jgi:hypothetical protein